MSACLSPYLSICLSIHLSIYIYSFIYSFMSFFILLLVFLFLVLLSTHLIDWFLHLCIVFFIISTTVSSSFLLNFVYFIFYVVTAREGEQCLTAIRHIFSLLYMSIYIYIYMYIFFFFSFNLICLRHFIYDNHNSLILYFKLFFCIKIYHRKRILRQTNLSVYCFRGNTILILMSFTLLC